MKVLLIHNFYGSSAPSGENLVVEQECLLLREAGFEVDCYFRNSDDLRSRGRVGQLIGGMLVPWNFAAARAIRRKVLAFQPDIIHIHNTFPLISPSVFWAVRELSPVVMTLHNYRVFCPAAIPLREGKVCDVCIRSRTVGPALRHGCYRDSRVATLPLAASVWLHRRLNTWNEAVDAFVTLTDFQRSKMIEGGLEPSRVHVKPNPFPSVPPVVDWASRKHEALFVGRLSDEKGLRTLISAWLGWGSAAPQLRIIGDGPLAGWLSNVIATQDIHGRIQAVGQVSSEAAIAATAESKLLIVPSEWYEGFPLVVRDAFAVGTPVAVSDIGSLATIVRDGDNGVLFPAANAAALQKTVSRLWSDQSEMQRLANGARQDFLDHYTVPKNLQILKSIYAAARSSWLMRSKKERKT